MENSEVNQTETMVWSEGNSAAERWFTDNGEVKVDKLKAAGLHMMTPSGNQVDYRKVNRWWIIVVNHV